MRTAKIAVIGPDLTLSMNNFHVGNACSRLIAKPLSRMESLSQSRGGSKVTKPIYTLLGYLKDSNAAANSVDTGIR